MKTFQVNVKDLYYLTLYEDIVKGLPSLTQEQRTEKSEELGGEPVCQENINDKIFSLGMRIWVDKEVPVFSAIRKASEANLYTRVAKILVDLHSVANARLKAAKAKHGVGTPQYQQASTFLDVVSIIVAHIDAEVSGDDSLKKIITQTPDEKPKAHPKKGRKR
jgi:hypothetical protein